MSADPEPRGVIFDNGAVRVVAKPSKQYEDGTDYHLYATDRDDFGQDYWKWIGCSGQDPRGVRFAQQGRR